MAIRISPTAAAELVERAAKAAEASTPHENWESKIERLSELCELADVRTHIAFFGTAALAKAADHTVDLRAIKPTHSVGNDNAFSARTLCHSVLVPNAARLGFNLGVTGREPLNNNPYFRMTRLSNDATVRGKSRAAYEYMLQLVDELQSADEHDAFDALISFIRVRRRYKPVYADASLISTLPVVSLIQAVRGFASAQSDRGKRAQAIVAGIFSSIYGQENVRTGRVNDPSRRFPGDVSIAVNLDDVSIRKAVEVRDKAASLSDVFIFANKCIEHDIDDVSLVLSAKAQSNLDLKKINAWATEAGITITLFYEWEDLVGQAIYWGRGGARTIVKKLTQDIRHRLIEVEAPIKAVEEWDSLVSIANVSGERPSSPF
jgi:hypothetical protein